MQKHKVAFIGTGGRSIFYAQAFQAGESIEIVGLADPNKEQRSAMSECVGLPKDEVVPV